MSLVENDHRVNGLPTFVNFNQDFTSVLVGTQTGYRLYSLNSINSLDKIYEYVGGGVKLIERLFSSSLLAVVGTSTPCKLSLWHIKKGSEICNYVYPSTIIALHLNRQRLIVCLENSIYIHGTNDMKLLHIISDTIVSSVSQCSLSLDDCDVCYVAYPVGGESGVVNVFDAISMKTVATIAAHNNQLACLALNSSGKILATASVKGTIIRVFSVSTGELLYEFRRGVKRYATIYSLTFSNDSQFLACSSNTETVHVFQLSPSCTPHEPDGNGWIDYIGKALKTSASYLPASDFLTQTRDYAVARLPTANGFRNVCAVASVEQQWCLMLASHDGSLFVYNFDSTNYGTECALLKQHSLNNNNVVVVGENGLVGTTKSPELAINGKHGMEEKSPELAQNDELSTAPCESDGNKTRSTTTAPTWGGPTRLSYASVIMSKQDEPVDWHDREQREINSAASTSCTKKKSRRKAKSSVVADKPKEEESMHLDDEEEFPSMTCAK